MPDTEERTHDAQPALFGSELGPSENGAGFPKVESFRREGDHLVRTVETRDGERLRSRIDASGGSILTGDDLGADFDASCLRAEYPPVREDDRGTLRVVDLFSGCGGMTLGVEEAAAALNRFVEPVLAIDDDPTALDVYSGNFSDADARTKRVENLFGLEPGDEFGPEQRQLRDALGEIDILLGGPPCQGHSNLNNNTRRDDPKNALFFTMARAAELLRPEHVIVENVRDIVHDEDEVFRVTGNYFANELDYSVSWDVLKAERLGVPQRRHRMFLVASRTRDVSVQRMVAPFRTRERNFVWACGDLTGAPGRSGFDAATQPADKTQRRIDWLHENEEWNLPEKYRPPCHQDGHTYPGVYGRMKPDEPAPTITTGFPYMGQGRFVHPSERRTITPHEAARLQFFPDWFEFGDLSRAAYKRLIGNAVPPKLTYVLALQLLR